MKKYIFSLVILVCILQYAHPQTNIETKEFILDTVYRYEVISPCIYEMLDTLSNNLHNCIFNILNRDYFYCLDIYDNNNIRVQIYSYKSYNSFSFAPMAFYRKAQKDNKGFFYYKNRLALVEFTGEKVAQSRIEEFFSTTDSLEVLKYQVPKERLPEVGMGLEVVTLHCLYDTISKKIIITDIFKCTGERYYSYIIQEGDTWEKIADKFATTVDKIRILNGEYDEREIPPKGHPIMVHYVIVNGVLEVYRKTTRFDRIPMDENWKGKRSKRDLW